MGVEVYSLKFSYSTVMTLTISFYCFLISTVDDDYSESLLIQTPEYYSLFAVHNSILLALILKLIVSNWPPPPF